jgi:hypothetical protein
MQQRDYILRMIEQMGAVLARLRQQLLGGAPVAEEARQEADRAGVDLDLARVLDAESLVELLSPEGQPDITRVWFIAELLYLDGLQSEQAGRLDEAVGYFRKALRLYLTLDPRILGGLPEAGERVTDLESRLGGARATRPGE